MNTLITYMVKAAIYLVAFYIVYSLMLSMDKSYVRNRAFILLSLALSLILPFFTLQTIKPMNIQLFGKLLSEVFVTATPDGAGSLNTGLSGIISVQRIYSIYITGAVAFLIKLLVDLMNLTILIINKKNQGSRIIRFHGFNTAGFSAMGHIFISAKLNPEEVEEIIKHEQNHLRLYHFIDIIFIEIIKSIQWFNPAVYLFNRSLRAIHEYQADQECLSTGIPVVNYQNLLLNQVFRSKAFNLTNSFSNPSLIKKRMIMMTKKHTSSLANIKLIFVIPVVGIVFLAISACREIPAAADQNSEKDQGITQIERATGKSDIQPFVVVEEMPMFPGGDVALLNYISKNTTYPEVAKEKNIQGRVIIRFCVTENGSIDLVSVLKGVDPELDAEAVRVVKTLPAFNPGRQGGKEVPVWYMVPITFTLK
jgi:TonB family protein